MADVRSELEKLKKEDILNYAVDVATKFNDLAVNYNGLVERNNVLQTQVIDLTNQLENTKSFVNDGENSEVVKELNDKINEMVYINESTKNELETYKTKVESLTNEYTQLEITLKETNNELNDALAIIENLKIENNSKKLEDINALPKQSNGTLSIQTYNIYGYENRVDNSKNYGGRQFCIATVIVKYENSILRWKIDFKGSELYPAKVYNRYKVFDEKERGLLAGAVSRTGWFATLRDYLSIPTEFDVNTFYNTGLFFGTEDKSN